MKARQSLPLCVLQRLAAGCPRFLTRARAAMCIFSRKKQTPRSGRKKKVYPCNNAGTCIMRVLRSFDEELHSLFPLHALVQARRAGDMFILLQSEARRPITERSDGDGRAARPIAVGCMAPGAPPTPSLHLHAASAGGRELLIGRCHE